MIIGLCGFIGSGKDTVAKILEVYHSFECMAYASPLKDIVSSVFGWNRKMLEGDTPESRLWREVPDEWWSERLGQSITPRAMLQRVGTDMFRNVLSPAIWTTITERKLRNSSSRRVVLTDCRFEEEVELVRKLGGVIVYVHRKDPEWKEEWDLYHERLQSSGNDQITQEIYKRLCEKVHPSEFMICGLQPDAIIDNTGTIEYLKEQVHILLDHLDPKNNV